MKIVNILFLILRTKQFYDFYERMCKSKQFNFASFSLQVTLYEVKCLLLYF
jgi:hypothetical protein